MACNNEIHQDDLGTEFLVTITECLSGVDTPLDISPTIGKEIIFTQPDGTRLVKSAVFTPITSGGTGDGTDGKLSYFTVVGDLDQVGTYKMQGVVTTAAGKWSSTIEKFKVKANL